MKSVRGVLYLYYYLFIFSALSFSPYKIVEVNPILQSGTFFPKHETPGPVRFLRILHLEQINVDYYQC